MVIPELLRPQYLVESASYCMRSPAQKLVKDRLIEGEMAHESHMIEAGYHVYKEI